jgi:hypothetical protein
MKKLIAALGLCLGLLTSPAMADLHLMGKNQHHAKEIKRLYQTLPEKAKKADVKVFVLSEKEWAMMGFFCDPRDFLGFYFTEAKEIIVRAGKSWDPLSFAHEWGHAVWDTLTEEEQVKWVMFWFEHRELMPEGDYYQKNPFESWAECFGRTYYSKDKKQSTSKEVQSVVREIMGS